MVSITDALGEVEFINRETRELFRFTFGRGSFGVETAEFLWEEFLPLNPLMMDGRDATRLKFALGQATVNELACRRSVEGRVLLAEFKSFDKSSPISVSLKVSAII